eukprot:3627488-Rhodomonas_salina.7
MLVPDRAYRAQWETGTGTLMIEEKADAMPVYLGPPGSSIADMAAVLAVSTQPRTGVPSGEVACVGKSKASAYDIHRVGDGVGYSCCRRRCTNPPEIKRKNQASQHRCGEREHRFIKSTDPVAANNTSYDKTSAIRTSEKMYQLAG